VPDDPSQHDAASELGDSIDPVHLRRVRVLCTLGALVALSVGTIVLVGWAFDVGEFMALAQGVNMKANSAVCLCGSSAALLLLREQCAASPRRSIGRALAAGVALIGMATLSQHIVGWDLGIDQLLFEEPRGAVATVSPNRMGPPASFSFVLIGLSLLSIDATPRERFSLSQALAAMVGAICTLPTLGYLSGARQLFGIAAYTGIAAHTALTLIVLAMAIFVARPERRPARLLIQKGAGGRLVRGLLPATFVAPLLVQLALSSLESRGLIGVHFGRALLLLVLIVLFAALVWGSAARVAAETRARDRAERTTAEMLDRERVARTEAVRAGQLKDDFVATVSHELRTPLNAMLGWAAIIRNDGTDTAQLHRGLAVIERNARLQAQLIDDLLDMSRIASGKLRVDVQSTDLCALLHAVIGSHAPAAAAKGIALTVNADDPTLHVQVDPARMQQVVWNLISNALKFTAKGGHVTASVRREAETVEIEVADDGAGIDSAFLPHVFDRFRQSDSSTARRHGGLGLGLSIARTLVEMHGGTVEAHSAGLGRGATFTVRLPALSDQRAEVPAAGTQVRHTRGRLEGVRLLIVEDDDDARELLQQVLSELGAEVESAADAPRALEQIGASVPDVLITDIGLPGQDGYALLGHVRAQHDQAALPAIALTAFARAEDRQRALREGFQAYLTKPVNFEALFRAIEALAFTGGRTDR
jgi:signal transduction histidine kinase/ActR/RegA family two-component response regulator